MGLSLSLLLSAWNGTLRYMFSGLKDTIETVIARSPSFKKEDSEIVNKGLDKLVIERSMSFQNWESMEVNLEPSDSSKNAVPDSEKSDSISSIGKNCEKMKIKKPTILLPKPVILFSPKPVCQLDAAATKLQKVYKSYRTRRNLADCAVVVEELWYVYILSQFLSFLEFSTFVSEINSNCHRWKALDFAALKQSSVSFFNIEKPETAVSRWSRARTRAARVLSYYLTNLGKKKVLLETLH